MAERTLKEYATPSTEEPQAIIVYPTVAGNNFEIKPGRILDGLSLGAKERDLEQIGHENTKIGKQNISPTSQKPGTARASLGTAVPPSRDLLLLLLGLQAILFWRTIY
ncbi:hypothetical protein MTR_0404s0010 [Medicago truncatula]|uniref:Uncharacterized protein n=1 Tax=Medicago truncatula TaxID=3880 RepID=A0A072TG67_MEDTR|nr:hypothetical protein MTR_0404s0010 [Medicago truncatula]